MQIKQSTQSPEDALKDRVYAAMETGNHKQARTLMREIAAERPDIYNTLRLEVIAEYGITL
jgi:hypothetical protein